MMPQVQALLVHIFDDPGDAERDCQLAQAALAGLIAAALDGQAPSPADAAAWPHIQSCTVCGALYRDSLQLARAERHALLEAPPVEAQFDFSYLDARPTARPRSTPTAKPAANPLWWIDEAGRLIVRFAADFLASLQPSALQPAYLKGAGQAASETISIAAADLTVHLRVEPQAGESARCVIEAAVEIPSRGGWPNLAGIPVSLRHGERELAARETDAFGHVVFDNVPATDLGGLECVIAPANADFRSE